MQQQITDWKNPCEIMNTEYGDIPALTWLEKEQKRIKYTKLTMNKKGQYALIRTSK